MDIKTKRIIKKIKKHDESGIELLVRTHGGLLKYIINKHLYQLESHEEECFNDVLLSIWNNIDYYDSNRSSFKNWIGVIARFQAIDILRKYRKELHDESYQLDTGHATDSFWKMEFEDLIRSLKPIDQKLLTYIYIDGYSVKESAELLGITPDSAYNHVSRARKRLREGYNNE
ncbi:sigma-70 family RNA polymerase sigma factor [Salinicoccus sesuvii]|uniref:Sigma-70 family RNA polymerase sigma factor n=1 Tax=Salinicoccus sesuvii TaxID=868281 RepID=A0ABV7N7F3_9STAP